MCSTDCVPRESIASLSAMASQETILEYKLLLACCTILMVISLCLSVANLVSIVILSRGRCGLSTCVTHYLVAMSVADLMVIIIAVIFYRIIPSYFRNPFVSITPVCRALMVLSASTSAMSVWFTVAFTFDRYVAICCQNLKAKYCTKKTCSTLIVVLSAIFFAQNIPWCFAVEPQYIVNDIPWECVYYTLATWKAFERLQRVVAPIFGFAMICLFNALIIRQILIVSKVRRRLRDQRNEQKTIDPKLENRKKSVNLLFAISGSFILLWTTFVVYSLKWQLSNFNYSETFVNTRPFIVQESGIMLQRLSSCINPCIYGLTQTKVALRCLLAFDLRPCPPPSQTRHRARAENTESLSP
uniref:G-protein coupled receptors family 1 profile domain-containing protein n=1 Tax=Callorhinchus milii TaxID=7868 RepID=A0A4W3HAD6_CALMI